MFRSCHGFVEIRVVPNRGAAPSPFMVFVDFETIGDAAKAIRLLNGYAVDLKRPDDARLIVRFAQRKKTRS